MSNASDMNHDRLASNLEDNRNRLQERYRNCCDFIVQDCPRTTALSGFLVYFDGLVSDERINEIRETLAGLGSGEALTGGGAEQAVQEKIGDMSSSVIHTFTELADAITIGNAVLLTNGSSEGYTFALAEWRKRAIDEPMAESVVRGPREGFTEAFNDNLAMIRRKVRTPDLKMKRHELGLYTKTRVAIAYVEGLVEPALIEEVERRLARIEVDSILESGNIEEFIEDQPYSPFPQMVATERPDTACANLLEGRFVILTDGTPFALVAPISFFSLLQSPEDYYQRYMISTMVRWLRYLFFFVALLAPSVYVAILTYHQEMIPTSLMLSVAGSREEIPFPALVEAFIMEIMFEALREAGVRLPKQVGAAVSIVGALVIGQAATSAGLVSSPMVMVVAITGIASFMLPHYTLGIAVRMLRFPIMLLAGMLGLLGILLAMVAIGIHLCSLRSFGIPYFSPMAPAMRGEWKDVLARVPAWSPSRRPKMTGFGGGLRRGKGMRPAVPRKKGE
ncbi:spore germination protein [Paenibacillus nasutitermitis]|uniref:Membrane protein YfkQ n=1 Tax=Paenibacillus nasutitermitis TaxID=1652958 RepID=A0A917E2I2_9BACL|nr:spore germination protein [Paenibacillus nasutitermitis]GGD93386.1 putative membrane protein YfkQ [Paenibacillus nasutitermitis]